MSELKPKIIVVTGPECSGKTTLTRELAQHLNEPWVPEYAREYLSNLNRPYVAEDLLVMAKGQLQAIEEARLKAREFLMVDTGPEVIQIWYRDKFGPEPTELKELATAFKPSIYLLCKPDIPYVPDPLREDPLRRDELFNCYAALLKHEIVQVVEGSQKKRLFDSVNCLKSTAL